MITRKILVQHFHSFTLKRYYCGINIVNNEQKINFSIKISLANVTRSAVSWNLVTFTEEIVNGKLHFCAV